jgi:hypothetical protein
MPIEPTVSHTATDLIGTFGMSWFALRWCAKKPADEVQQMIRQVR